MKKIILFIIIFSMHSFAQTIYQLPFASKGNQIELTVENESEQLLDGITVAVAENPEWICFENLLVSIEAISSHSELPAIFEFNVDKKAPVDEKGKIVFKIKNSYGDEWEKEILVNVSKPVDYSLSQNYPNPFNPSTKIEFVIPNAEKVTIKIYDILGREVKTLMSEFKEAGHHEVIFNGSSLSSGTYIYSLISGSYNQNKKMLLLR